MDNTSASVGSYPMLNGCMVFNYTEYVPWNNPYDIVSYEAFAYFQTAVSSVYLPILFLISTPANILCMLVFYQHGLRERINLCVFCLSLADLIFVTYAFLQFSDTVFMKLLAGSRYSGMLGIVLKNNVMGIFGFWWTSAFITTLIACERCACVVSPLRAHLLLKTNTTAAIIVVAAIVIVGPFFIVSARWTVGCVYDPVAKSPVHTTYSSDFYLAHAHLVDTLEGVVYGIILPVFCVSVVTTASAITAVKLRHMAAWRQQTSSAASSSPRDVTLSRMLIGMSILFVTCNVPGICFRIAMLAVPDMSLDGKYRNSFHLLFFFHQFFAYTNSSFNFFVYYRFGTKFRETVKTVFCRCCAVRRRTKIVSKDNIFKTRSINQYCEEVLQTQRKETTGS